MTMEIAKILKCIINEGVSPFYLRQAFDNGMEIWAFETKDTLKSDGGYIYAKDWRDFCHTDKTIAQKNVFLHYLIDENRIISGSNFIRSILYDSCLR